MSTTTTTLTTDTQTARAALDRLRTTRQDAETQARTLAQECAVLKGRGAALALDAQLGRAGAAAERADAAARLAAAEAQLEEQRQLVAEAARREPAAIEALHTAALAEAEVMLAELDTEVAALVAQIRREREDAPPEIRERVVVAARQAAGLAHDLLAATSARRFHRAWVLREQLGPEVAALIPQLTPAPYVAKSPIARPWAELLADLAEGRP
jgi:hypothetical protein